MDVPPSNVESTAAAQTPSSYEYPQASPLEGAVLCQLQYPHSVGHHSGLCLILPGCGMISYTACYYLAYAQIVYSKSYEDSQCI